MAGVESRRDPEARLGIRRGLVAFGLFLGLAVATTWPLAAHLGDATASTSSDPRLTAWITAWQAKTLASEPTRVFQAPFYHPTPDALALTDHQLGLAPITVPLAWLTGNPYVANNVTILLALAFACFAAALLGREVTGSNAAAWVAGAAYGLAPYWGEQLSHTQIVTTSWIPLGMFAIFRWGRTWQPGWMALAATSMVMAALISWYQGVFAGVGMGVAGLVLLVANRPPSIRPWAHAALAATLAVGVLVPFTFPYGRIGDRDPHFKRTDADVIPFSARPSWYLAAPRESSLYGSATTRWRKPQNDEAMLFPGVTITALAGIGMRGRRKDRRERAVWLAAVAVLVTGLVLSAGVGGHGVFHLPWGPLSDILPPFRALRAAARAHVLTVLGLSILAGFGAGNLLRRGRLPAMGVATALVLMIALEGSTAPRTLGPAPRAERIYQTIASRPGPVLEFPVRPPTGVESSNHGLEVNAMMRATAHWQPLIQGYAGYYPPSYLQLLREIQGFPDAGGLEAMRRAGVRTLVLRLDVVRATLRKQVEERIAGLQGLTLLGREGPVSVYDVSPTSQ